MKEIVLGRFVTLFAILGSLGVATAQLPVLPCMVAGPPAGESCLQDSCNNKVCCETAAHRTSAPSQTLVKNTSRDLCSAPSLALTRPLPLPAPHLEPSPLPIVSLALAPPSRVLLCTFLI
jgi:hypothetical protein